MDCDLTLRHRDGRPVWLLANFSVVETETGPFRQMLEATLVDISKRKQTEEDWRRATEAAEASKRLKQTGPPQECLCHVNQAKLENG